MSDINDGGPAFPFPELGTMNFGDPSAYPGMSMRDEFAKAAMQGMLAADIQCGPEEVPVIASSAYVMADAMLKARAAK